MRLIGWAALTVGVLVAAGTALWTTASDWMLDKFCTDVALEACKDRPNSIRGLAIAALLAIFGLIILAASPRPSKAKAAAEAQVAVGKVPPERETVARRTPLSLTLWYLPATALLFFTVAYIFASHKTETTIYFKEIFFAIGTAFFISWGFSVLLDIPHVSNFVTSSVADLLLGEEFLRRKRDLLPDLRRRIDRVVYGEAELAHPGSFYNFVSDQVEELFKSSYRRNFTVEIVCSECGADEVRWLETTRYVYIRNPADKDPRPIALVSERALTSMEHAAAKEDIYAFFASRVRSLSLRIGETIFTQDTENRRRLIKRGGTEAIDIVVGLEEGAFQYSFKYEVTRESLPPRGVEVEIVEEVIKQCRDDVYYSSVALPTEDFTLVGHFPQEVRLEAIRFSTGTSGGIETASRGRALVSINGWLMPGHGVCIGWFGLEKREVEAPKGSEKQGAADRKATPEQAGHAVEK